jgi:hypothetical protein
MSEEVITPLEAFVSLTIEVNLIATITQRLQREIGLLDATYK